VAAKPFSGTHFTIGIFNDPDPINLLSQIEAALSAARWIEVGWHGGGDIQLSRPGHPSVGFVSVQGVYIQADNSHASEFAAAVMAVAAAFPDNIPAKPEIGRMPANTNNDVVQILIGKK